MARQQETRQQHEVTESITDFRLDPGLQEQRSRVEHLHAELTALGNKVALASAVKCQAEVNLSACEEDLISGRCDRAELTKRRAELATAVQLLSDAQIEMQSFQSIIDRAPAGSISREMEAVVGCQRRLRAKHDAAVARLVPLLIESGKIVAELNEIQLSAEQQRQDFESYYCYRRPDLYAYRNAWSLANMPWARLDYGWSGSHLNGWLSGLFRDAPELLPAEERSRQAVKLEESKPRSEAQPKKASIGRRFWVFATDSIGNPTRLLEEGITAE